MDGGAAGGAGGAGGTPWWGLEQLEQDEDNTNSDSGSTGMLSTTGSEDSSVSEVWWSGSVGSDEETQAAAEVTLPPDWLSGRGEPRGLDATAADTTSSEGTAS